MQVAIYAEGRADLAVITNILHGKLDIDLSDIKYDLPEFEFDETDLHSMSKEQFSNWTLVKQECIERERISTFLSLGYNRFVVIQIDTAERFLVGYDVPLPAKATTKDYTAKHYSSELRTAIVAKVNQWLDNNHSHQTAYAICIEEIEAWLLAVASTDNETAKHNDPKKRLQTELNKKLSDKDRKKLFNKSTYQQFYELSKDFRKEAKLDAASKHNQSLADFCDDLEKFKQ